MVQIIFSRWSAAALLLAAAPAIAQVKADDPTADVPETRYQAAHEHRAPSAAGATPDRNWRDGNRAVTPRHGADPHAGHAPHGQPAQAAKPVTAPDPHAHHHGHHAGHDDGHDANKDGH